jgi:hypothetical protein
MNIYDVPQLQQYLNPGIDPRAFQSVFPTNVPFDPRPFQSVFPTNVQAGIPSTSAAFSFQPTFQDFYNPVYTPYDSEKDDDQVDYIGEKPNKIQTGIAKLFEFLQRFSPVANIARGVESLRNRFDTNRAIREDIIRDSQGTINRITSPRIMNMQPSDRDTARGSMPTRSPAPSRPSSYSEAKSAFTAGR